MHTQETPVEFAIAACPGGTCVRLQFGVTTVHLRRQDFQSLLVHGWQVLAKLEAREACLGGELNLAAEHH